MVWLVVNRVTGLESGVYRFHQQDHCLELHKPGSVGDALVRACLNQRFLRDASVVLALAAVYDRTTARYGERGVRYVHMECGHAGQNISLQAAALGLGTVAVGAFEDDAVQRVLDVPHPVVYLFPVGFPK
jgi:SagB-type dehydrogenase family enzyme